MPGNDEDFIARYRVAPGEKAHLKERDARDMTGLDEKNVQEAATAELAREIDHWQDRLYAEGERAVLVVLQGTDTSGKDGTIRSVFNTTGPLGVSVTPFKRPSAEELAHDYLWRVHRACPERGHIGIFNRSHYEDVLVARVRKLAPAEAIERRYDQINAFERMLVENGTTILKFMLNISKAEQGRPEEALEVRPGRPRGPDPLGRVPGRLRDPPPPVLDPLGALARGAGRPQMGAQRRDRADRQGDARGDEPGLSAGRLEAGGVHRGLARNAGRDGARDGRADRRWTGCGQPRDRAWTALDKGGTNPGRIRDEAGTRVDAARPGTGLRDVSRTRPPRPA
jgi:polyphosphate kinase 2 (PPK2 family)